MQYISPEIAEKNQELQIKSEDFLPNIIANNGNNINANFSNKKKNIITNFGNIEIPDITEIKKEDFDEWRLSLSDNGLSIKTVNAHMITMRSWLKFLKKQGVDCIDPTTLDLIKAEDREVTFLTNDEIINFFKSITTDTIQ